MRCATCGEELREGAKFCPTCGTPAAESAASAGVTPATMRVERPVEPAAARGPAGAAAGPSPAGRPAEGVPRRDPGAGYDPTGASPYGARRAAGEQQPSGQVTAPPMTVSGEEFALLLRRLLRLARLDTGVFADIYRDAGATVPIAVYAAAVLVISGLGGFLLVDSLYGSFDVYDRIGGSSAGGFFLRSVVLGTIFALVLLGVWSGATMLVLRQLARVETDALGLARVFGVAITPLALALLLFIDDIFFGLSWIAMGGITALALIGLMESVDVRPGPAWVATLAGFVLFVAGLAVLGHGFRDLAPGFFVGA